MLRAAGRSSQAKARVEGIRCHVPCGGMRAHPVELGFHIADAEDVALAYDGESLMLSFLDWRQQPVRVAFDEAVAFRWQRADEVHPGESWDGTNVHLDSPWLEEHRRQGEATTSHQHFALNFNAAGRLEVVSTGARVVAG